VPPLIAAAAMIAWKFVVGTRTTAGAEAPVAG
jgi:hypothetical protein